MSEIEGKRIFHLHGSISYSSSIVISQDKYMELYKNDVYKALFSIFSGVKTFLFIGFSFDDVFIQNIIKDNNEAFKSKHYIILENPTDENIIFLKQKYNLETISYDPSKTSHQIEIRKIIDEICSDKIYTNKKELDDTETIIDKLPNREDMQKLENNLFCKKLRIENI